VDTAQGLSRLRGNQRLYEKLLRHFAQDSGQLLEKLKADAKAERFENCRAVAHNLKGVAGNIGADRLHEVLADLEQATLDKHEDLPARLAEALGEARRVAEGILEAYPPENDSEVPGAEQGRLQCRTIQSIRPELEKLLGLLDRHDIDAQKLFGSLRDQLTESAPAWTRDLDRLIDHFEFASAGNTLRKLMDECEDKNTDGED
jgi:HPt (histidine-containing phosphotransfer) domain-containing protein